MPQPDGPMNAVTLCSAMSRSMFFSAWKGAVVEVQAPDPELGSSGDHGGHVHGGQSRCAETEARAAMFNASTPIVMMNTPAHARLLPVLVGAHRRT